MDAKLVVVGGEAKSGEVKIKKLPSVVGRGDEADIRLRHPLVSRKHCEIFESGGVLKVRDLGSLNGTFVASARIKEAVLKPDQLITIGPVISTARILRMRPTSPKRSR
jgi:pSer/pThr/pTyr-binding forkhead associated (FHA) protein